MEASNAKKLVKVGSSPASVLIRKEIKMLNEQIGSDKVQEKNILHIEECTERLARTDKDIVRFSQEFREVVDNIVGPEEPIDSEATPDQEEPISLCDRISHAIDSINHHMDKLVHNLSRL